MTAGSRLSLSARLTLILVVLVVVAQSVSLVGFTRLRAAEGASWRLPAPVRIAAAARSTGATFNCSSASDDGARCEIRKAAGTPFRSLARVRLVHGL